MATPPTHITTVRVPVQLREELARQARANERSLNREIVYRLRQTLDPAPVPRRESVA
jgi:hypothetical protein